MSYELEEQELIDDTFPQNKVIEENNPDDEIAKEFNRNLEEEED